MDYVKIILFMDFIAEFKKLLFATPTYNLRSVHNTNCPYVHMVSYSKDEFFKRVAQIKGQLRTEKKYFNWLPDVVGKID